MTGRYRKDSIDTTGRIAQDGDYFKNIFLTDSNFDLVEGLDAIAKRKNCSMAQLAIAWLLSHEVISSVIAGVTKMEQLADNAKAPSVELSEDDLIEINGISEW